MKYILTLILILSLTACAGTGFDAVSREAYGDLRVTEPDSPTHDYKFYTRAAFDFTSNTHKPEDRLKIFRAYLKNSCADIQVIDEQFLPAGDIGIGSFKHGTYVSRIKCIK